jgi:putative membrane protein
MGFIIAVLVNAAALWVAVTVLDGIDYAGEWYQWLILGLIFGLVNAIVKPILGFFTLPITIITLGLFLIVLNTLMLYLTSFLAGPIAGPFMISSFLDGILGALIISIVGTALNFLLSRTGVK